MSISILVALVLLVLPDKLGIATANKKVINYALAEKYFQQFKKDCRVYLGFHTKTDHRLLKAIVCAPRTKNARRSCKNSTPPK